jgi:hypothetical protein
MPGNPVRYGKSEPTEPVVHELSALKYGDDLIPVLLEVRRAEDGTWRGRLIFGHTDDGASPATADILCATSEGDLWECLHDLREHHLRDLYRSVTE